MISVLKRGHNLAYILILNLLYPAVLGSIFYSVFSNLGTFRIGVTEISCGLMMVSVIIFFAIDFLYTYLHEKYSAFHFTSDCILLAMMQGAFNSINFLAGNVNSKVYCFYMALTFLVFVIWDFYQRDGLGKKFMKIIRLELVLVLIFISLGLRENSGYLLPAVVSVAGALSMTKFFLAFYLAKGQGGKESPAEIVIDTSVSRGEPTQAPLLKDANKTLSLLKASLGATSVIIIFIFRNILHKARRP